MSACPFAWDWMAAVTGPAGTRGCFLLEGQTFHDTAIATNSAVTWPPGTSIGRVRITKSILRDRDPCALTDLIAETVRRNPEITAFHVRPSGADYSSLQESLSTRLPSDHARLHSHYMAAHPVDAEPPTTLRFASTKPKLATFAKEGWHKEAAKRKLFLFDPRQPGDETVPIYSLSSRLAWERDGDGPGLTVPSAYAASGLLALPVTSTPLFVAHEDPLLEVPSDCPTAVNSDPSTLPACSTCSSGVFLRSMRWRRRTRRRWRSPRSVGQGCSTTTVSCWPSSRSAGPQDGVGEAGGHVQASGWGGTHPALGPAAPVGQVGGDLGQDASGTDRAKLGFVPIVRLNSVTPTRRVGPPPSRHSTRTPRGKAPHVCTLTT